MNIYWNGLFTRHLTYIKITLIQDRLQDKLARIDRVRSLHLSVLDEGIETESCSSHTLKLSECLTGPIFNNVWNSTSLQVKSNHCLLRSPSVLFLFLFCSSNGSFSRLSLFALPSTAPSILPLPVAFQRKFNMGLFGVSRNSIQLPALFAPPSPTLRQTEAIQPRAANTAGVGLIIWSSYFRRLLPHFTLCLFLLLSL